MKTYLQSIDFFVSVNLTFDGVFLPLSIHNKKVNFQKKIPSELRLISNVKFAKVTFHTG